VASILAYYVKMLECDGNNLKCMCLAGLVSLRQNRLLVDVYRLCLSETSRYCVCVSLMLTSYKDLMCEADEVCNDKKVNQSTCIAPCMVQTTLKLRHGSHNF